jgi:homoserine O-acetyltransferase
MNFPKYTYDDMVLANYKLLTEHLNVNHLRLVMGTSMGGMQSWVWGYTYPDFMDAIMFQVYQLKLRVETECKEIW